MKLYRVKDWVKLYENHKTRKLKSMQWVPILNEFDSLEWRQITRLDNGAAIIGVWTAILMLASRSRVRGLLMQGASPLGPEQVSIITAIRVDDVTVAFDRLLEFGILEVLEGGQSQKAGESAASSSQSVAPRQIAGESPALSSQESSRRDEAGDSDVNGCHSDCYVNGCEKSPALSSQESSSRENPPIKGMEWNGMEVHTHDGARFQSPVVSSDDVSWPTKAEWDAACAMQGVPESLREQEWLNQERKIPSLRWKGISVNRLGHHAQWLLQMCRTNGRLDPRPHHTPKAGDGVWAKKQRMDALTLKIEQHSCNPRNEVFGVEPPPSEKKEWDELNASLSKLKKELVAA